MCGRIDQRQAGIDYAMQFGWERARPMFNSSEATPRVNASPGTYRPVFHLVDGELHIDDLHWGFRPIWASAQKAKIYQNARLDKLTGKYWGSLLKRGRCIVPADGWYEWTAAHGKKWPWHIHLKTHEPVFMAGIANFGPFVEHKAESGFAIVTADALGGMIDVHDRRPVVLTAADAATWLSPDLPPEEAQHLLNVAGRPPEDFEWYRVSPEVNNSRNEAPDLAEPIDA